MDTVKARIEPPDSIEGSWPVTPSSTSAIPAVSLPATAKWVALSQVPGLKKWVIAFMARRSPAGKGRESVRTR